MTQSRSGGQVLVAGSANVDFVVRASHIAAPGETVLGGDLLTFPGGKGANQAVACARAGGADTAMLAALGDDAPAALLIESLRSAGVALTEVRSDRPTGAALITVSEDGENAITVAPGANMSLSPEHLPDLHGTAWLVMQLEVPLPTVLAMAKAARQAGTSVLLNAAPAQALPAELLANIDVLVVNEAELAAVTGREGSIRQRLSRVGVRCAVATLGDRGCCALQAGKFSLQPAFEVASVDTTAAGDTFTGVLAAALSQGDPLAEALRRAAAAGALATTQVGAQASIPEAADVDRLIAEGRTSSAQDLVQYCDRID